MKKSMLAALLGLSLGVAGSAMAGDKAAAVVGDAAAGQSKAMVCAACHGADGNSMNPEWPKLAGQGEGYLYKQLKEFKNGKRKNDLMAAQVAALSDQDMKDLAAFYATQTMSEGMADEKLVNLGRDIYRGGNQASGVSACIACHGPTGAGNPPAKFPQVAGQHAKYNAIQLHAFAKEERANDAGRMMRNIANKMTDAEIDAVVAYVQGLR